MMMSGVKAGECRAHHRPRAECRPEQTHTYSHRLRGDLMAAAERAALEMKPRISVNEFVARAIAAAAGWEEPPPAARQQAADAELDRLRAQRAAELTPKEELLAAALEAATEENPVTPAALQAVTGTESSKSYVSGHLAALLRAGAVDYRKDWRQRYYWKVPGADIRKAMKAPGGAEVNGKAPDTRALAPAPRKPATARTAPARVKSAAREKAGSAPRAVSRPPVAARKARAAAVVQAARDAGHDVRPASELAGVPATAVFKAGPEVDCPHDGFRGVKGVCPDCKQWVGGRR